MKARSLLLSLPAFLAAWGLGAAWRYHGVAPLGRGLPSGTLMEGRGAARAAEVDDLLVQVRRMLRAGDVNGAIAALSAAAEHDPKSFLRALRQLPYFSGLEGAVKSATEGLVWGDPEIAGLLNRIGPAAWRNLAWQDFVAAQVGKANDEELFRLAGQALFTQDYTHEGTPLELLFLNAAQNRPLEFAALLDRIDPDGDREVFYRAVMQAHPEILAEMQRAMKPGSLDARENSRTILDVRVQGLHTADDLAAALADAGPLGSYGRDAAVEMVASVYGQSDAGEQERILDLIAKQPPAARNKVMGELATDTSFDGVPVEKLNRMLGMSTSGEAQEGLLKEWMSSSQNMNTVDRVWASHLPSEKLRAQANAELDQH